MSARTNEIDNKEAIFLDVSNYALLAVHRTMYDFAATAQLKLETINDKPVVIVNPLNASGDSLCQHFLQALLDHQLRIDAENQYGVIRNIIVAQALQPRRDLQQVLQASFPGNGVRQ